jgi:hypothetical protein
MGADERRGSGLVVKPLGPFQAIWDKWEAADKEVKAKPFEHFMVAIMLQFQEILEARGKGDTEQVRREYIDIISLALNGLRHSGMRPHDIARLVLKRATKRYTDPNEILHKYERAYGI